MSEQPQGPGWWQASDGRWYPPDQQPGYPPTQQYEQPYAQQRPYPQQQPYQQPYVQQPHQQPPRRSGNRGCLVAVLVVLAIVLVGGGVAAYFIYQAVHQVAAAAKGVADGVSGDGQGGIPSIGIGNARCPTEDQIGGIVGTKVKLLVQGNVVVAAACNYQAADSGESLDVQIATGVAIIADDQIKEFESDAANADAQVDKIPVGERGEAYGNDQKGAAITVADSRLIQVEIDSDGRGSTDPKAAAVKVLQLVAGGG